LKDKMAPLGTRKTAPWATEEVSFQCVSESRFIGREAITWH
jgi:hypothetical protein